MAFLRERMVRSAPLWSGNVWRAWMASFRVSIMRLARSAGSPFTPALSPLRGEGELRWSMVSFMDANIATTAAWRRSAAGSLFGLVLLVFMVVGSPVGLRLGAVLSFWRRRGQR